jgi:hypothetical protein
MRSFVRKTAQLGEVVAAAFDHAASYSRDPREVSRLATQVIAVMLRPRRLTPSSSPLYGRALVVEYTL